MRALFFSLLLISLLGGCVTSMDSTKRQAHRLGAPTIPEAEECPDGIQSDSVPQYPEDALRSRTEGWVVVDIELSRTGEVLSRKIASEEPTGIFAQAALDSVDKNVFDRAASPRKCKMLYTFGLSR